MIKYIILLVPKWKKWTRATFPVSGELPTSSRVDASHRLKNFTPLNQDNEFQPHIIHSQRFSHPLIY